MSIRNSFANHLLVAMPSLLDPHFVRGVIYICEHYEEGTFGLMINRPLHFPLSMVFEQLHITSESKIHSQRSLLFGGPIQPERGFVIHRPAGGWRSSLALHNDVTITTSNDILKAMAQDKGPNDALITLGYASWSGNQLEEEIYNNAWLVCPYNTEILYEVPFEKRWEYGASLIGVKVDQLSSDYGHA